MANPTPDPAYLVPIDPTMVEGTKWACADAKLLQAINNAGITLDMSNPYNQPIQPTFSEGYKWACIGAKLDALVAGGGGGGGSGATLQTLAVPLVSGQTDGYTATFTTAFASAPKVAVVGVKTNTGSANIGVTIYAVTTTGFSFDLQGDPGAGATANFLAAV